MGFTYFISWMFLRWLFKLGMSARYSGREHLPSNGGFVLATNHISYFDPLIVGTSQDRMIYYLAKRELMANRFIAAFLRSVGVLPVRRGTVDREALQVCVDSINSGHGLLIFPEGTRSKTDEFLPPKPGVGMIARAAGCPIVPGYIHGSNMMRDCLLRRQKLSLSFGEPLSAEWIASVESGREGYHAIARETMVRIKLLRDG